MRYLECSAQTGADVADVFKTAAKIVLDAPAAAGSGSGRNLLCCCFRP